MIKFTSAGGAIDADSPIYLYAGGNGSTPGGFGGQGATSAPYNAAPGG